MLLNLTDRSPEPLHRQISFQLARRIIDGEIVAGQELPSLRVLAREQHVSRTTVERAYTELADEGLVRLRRRSSPVVEEIEPDQRRAIAVRIGLSNHYLLDALKMFSDRLASIFDTRRISELLRQIVTEYLWTGNVQIAVRDRPSGPILLRVAEHDHKPYTVAYGDMLLEHIRTAVAPVSLTDATVGVLQSDLARVLMERRVELICALRHADEFHGFVGLGPRVDRRPYTPEDTDLLMILARQFATALAMAGLYVDSIEKRKMEEELKAARQIQADLLPEDTGSGSPIGIAAFSAPSSAVGGDFYDHFVLDEARMGIVIADACGNGMPAAMLISQVQAMVRNEVSNGNSIESTIARLNRQLHRHAQSGFFATLFYGILDRKRCVLRFINAGHDFPVLVRRNGELNVLKSTGPALGAVEDLDHRVETIDLHEGDCILLYTDGITETTSSSGRQYGETQLRDLLIRNRHRSPRDILDFIRSDVERFASPGPPQDDRTVMLIKVNKLMEPKSDAA